MEKQKGRVSMKEHRDVRLNWREECRTLKLEGEPVLEYAVTWPEIQGAGLGGRWINRYYVHLARAWKRRWEREVYWQACLELGARRQRAQLFVPWKGELKGEVAYLENGLLSVRFVGWEARGDGRISRVRWGDIWKVREGAPCSVKDLCKEEKGWKKRLWKELVAQGERRREGGDCFLDCDWQKKARAVRPLENCCLTREGIEVSLPQGAATPMAEGCPVFLLKWEQKKTP